MRAQIFHPLISVVSINIANSAIHAHIDTASEAQGIGRMISVLHGNQLSMPSG
jgi:hypothetical protein